MTEDPTKELDVAGDANVTGSIIASGDNAVSGLDTGVLTKNALTITNPDDNDDTTTDPTVIPRVELIMKNVSSDPTPVTTTYGFRTVGPDSQDSGKTVL